MCLLIRQKEITLYGGHVSNQQGALVDLISSNPNDDNYPVLAPHNQNNDNPNDDNTPNDDNHQVLAPHSKQHLIFVPSVIAGQQEQILQVAKLIIGIVII